MGSDGFSFEISLSVLNHLGRNLYRSFATVLGEAISNSWDADAKNVWIYIGKNRRSFVIKDDGVGMTADDFQNKFLKIGYSKRGSGQKTSLRGRPFIGRKGIGKLALLSCADRITVVSKIGGGDYIGGVIDNTVLDNAIKADLTPDKYQLENWDRKKIGIFLKSHTHGTVLYFDGIKEGVKNSLAFLKKTIALYFRFSLLDDNFKIFLDDEQITYKHLGDLADHTEFLWRINEIRDPFIDKEVKNLKEQKVLKMKGDVKGFIASVGKPRDLKISTTDERVSVDLFVNGRIREKDILKHIPTARLVESYLYGQIHLDSLDDGEDRFTSSREGVVADDEKFEKFLVAFRKSIIGKILELWDEWRIRYREDGDSENERMSPKERKSLELFGVVSRDYLQPGPPSKKRRKIESWVDNLGNDAQFNFSSYAECFISENLIRNHIVDKKIALSEEATDEIKKCKGREKDNKGKGNISIDLRERNTDLSYLSMDDLAGLVDKKDPIKDACLLRDAREYKPIRDALMHTALLTGKAKTKLNTVYENIKGRLLALLP